MGIDDARAGAGASGRARRFLDGGRARKVLGGEELQNTATSTTFRTDSADGFITTDGPFLETKEVLGGFYLLEASDLDEAIKLASHLPEVHAGHSGVEIRPVVDHS